MKNLKRNIVVLLLISLLFNCSKKESESVESSLLDNATEQPQPTAESNLVGLWFYDKAIGYGYVGGEEIEGVIYDFNLDGTVNFGYTYNYDTDGANISIIERKHVVKYYYSANWSVVNGVLTLTPNSNVNSIVNEWTVNYDDNSSSQPLAIKPRRALSPSGITNFIKVDNLDAYEEIQDLTNFEFNINFLNGIWLSQGVVSINYPERKRAFQIGGGVTYQIFTYDLNSISGSLAFDSENPNCGVIYTVAEGLPFSNRHSLGVRINYISPNPIYPCNNNNSWKDISDIGINENGELNYIAGVGNMGYWVKYTY